MTAVMPNARWIDSDEVRARRDELVHAAKEAGYSLNELRADGAAWKLDARMRAILADIEAADFLLDQ